MATPLTTIINWFKTGLKPTEAQFKASWESFWHKDDEIPVANIENLEAYLLDKADDEALTNHIANNEIHVSLTEKETWNEKIGNANLAESKDDEISKIPNLGIVKDLVNNVDVDESKVPLINDHSPTVTKISEGEGVVATLIPYASSAYADILGGELAQDILDKVLNLEEDEEQLFKLVGVNTGVTGYVRILLSYRLDNTYFYLNSNSTLGGSVSGSLSGVDNIWFNEDGTDVEDSSIFIEGETYFMYAITQTNTAPKTVEEYLIGNTRNWEELKIENEDYQETKILESTQITFYNAWVSGDSNGVDPLTVYKKGDVVWLEGTISGGSENQLALTLPEGFRPTKNIINRLVFNKYTGGVLINITEHGELYTTIFDTGEDLTFCGMQFLSK